MIPGWKESGAHSHGAHQALTRGPLGNRGDGRARTQKAVGAAPAGGCASGRGPSPAAAGESRLWRQLRAGPRRVLRHSPLLLVK
ncbi:hypothetical protein I79_012328 [Cricetulus griseus]|uniref:Uncharacterized protein n=1 Tax=Cricetulus griseus TaxID=10029 RepID=G3HNJ0_CRIGR|nr:hypothetical protein I79_012328 [Cricetulus griseus]